MNTFGEKIITYRKRLGMNQRTLAERSYLDPSHLNRIEKGARKPPARENLLQMVTALRLTHDESVELLQLAGYSPIVLEESKAKNGDKDRLYKGKEQSLRQTLLEVKGEKMASDVPSYPPIPKTRVENHLWGIEHDFPVWYLSADGTVTDVNLPALWLWNSPLDEHIHKKDLVGMDAFLLFCQPWNFERIALPTKPNHFWWITILVEKLFEERLDPRIVAIFKKTIFKEPLLRVIYEGGDSVDIGRGWYSYLLQIKPPQTHIPLTATEDYLEFWMSIEMTRTQTGDIAGFAVQYQPANDQTRERIEKETQRAVAKHHRGAFVQRLHGDRKTHFHPSFPNLTKNSFWYITGTNEAFQHMVTGLAHHWQVEPVAVEGMHFLELICSLPMRKPVEALGQWQASFLRAVTAFKNFTEIMLQEHPESHAELAKTIDYLNHTLGDDFQKVYHTIPPYTAVFPTTFDEPFYACTISYLPSPHTQKEQHFELESWVWLPQDHTTDYLLTFVPANKPSLEALSQLSLPSFKQRESSANN